MARGRSLYRSHIEVGENSVALVGWEEGGAGQIASWLEVHSGYRIACFVHPDDRPPRIRPVSRDCAVFDTPKRGLFKGKPLLCSCNWPRDLADRGVRKVLVTVSENRERLRLIRQAIEGGLSLINAIHPSAVILPEARISTNITVHARAIVGYRAEVGMGAILNIGAQVDHHDVLRDGCLIGPGTVLAGNVTVGECSTVWAGAVVINKIRIGKDSVVGAGAVIIRDVPDRVTVAGVPGRILGRRSAVGGLGTRAAA